MEANKQNNLISCSACDNKIATSAESCPSCGAINSWTHPTIKIFASQDPEAIPPIAPAEFQYHYQGSKIQGTTNGMPWWGYVLVVLTALPGFLFTIVGFWITCIATYFFFKSIVFKNKEFYADLSVGRSSWTSNDEKFWADVKKSLFPEEES